MELMFPPVANADFLEVTTRPLLSAAECDRVVERCDAARWSSARVEEEDGGAYGNVRLEERSVTQQLLPVDGDGWPMDVIARVLTEINDEVYRFRLSRIPAADVPTVLRYETTTNDHFRPHTDIGRGNATRKLSYSVQLSEPTAYDGCDLVFQNRGQPASRQRGSITVFPSFLFHTVTPVYAGVRYAVVGWVHGPTFR